MIQVRQPPHPQPLPLPPPKSHCSPRTVNTPFQKLLISSNYFGALTLLSCAWAIWRLIDSMLRL